VDGDLPAATPAYESSGHEIFPTPRHGLLRVHDLRAREPSVEPDQVIVAIAWTSMHIEELAAPGCAPEAGAAKDVHAMNLRVGHD
jgi:hypothetical protein